MVSNNDIFSFKIDVNTVASIKFTELGLTAPKILMQSEKQKGARRLTAKRIVLIYMRSKNGFPQITLLVTNMDSVPSPPTSTA